MSENEKKKTRNVFILGGAFGLIFTGFLTIAATAETILRSYQTRVLSIMRFLKKKIIQDSKMLKVLVEPEETKIAKILS